MRKDRRDNLKKGAADRQVAYDKLTVAEKITKLDKKLGAEVGAKRQRARLVKEKS